MRCYHCGQEIDNNVQNCPYCGANQGAGATVVLDQMYNPYAAEPESGRTDALWNAQPVAVQTYGSPEVGPRIQFATNRSLLKMFFLGLITFGIYDLVVWCKLITELNVTTSRYDGRRTMPFFAMTYLAPLTLGILPMVWFHNLSERIGDELKRRDIDYKFGSSTYWLWSFLGSLILVGPLVYTHKLLKAMNMINEDFNLKG